MLKMLAENLETDFWINYTFFVYNILELYYSTLFSSSDIGFKKIAPCQVKIHDGSAYTSTIQRRNHQVRYIDLFFVFLLVETESNNFHCLKNLWDRVDRVELIR